MPTRAHSPVWDWSVEPYDGRRGQNHPPAEDHQQRREEGEHHAKRHGDADRGDRTESLRGVHAGHEQAQHPRDHGRATGEDRRTRAPQRECHRLVPVLMPPELFPVSGDEQQCIVRASPEHQHGEDSGALCVDGEIGPRGEKVDHCLRDQQRDNRGEDREDPEQRAAIGEKKNHDHDRDRRVQQLSVDAGERLRGVRGETSRPREVHRQPLWSVRADVAHGLDRGSERLPPAATGVDGDDHLEGFLVLGRDRTHSVALDTFDVVEIAHLSGDGSQVVRRHAARTLIDDNRGDLVTRLELPHLLQHLGGLSIPRQPRDGVVLLRPGQLSRRSDRKDENHEPEAEQDPLGRLAGRKSGQATKGAPRAQGAGSARDSLRRTTRPPQVNAGFSRDCASTDRSDQISPSHAGSAGARAGQPSQRLTGI